MRFFIVVCALWMTEAISASEAAIKTVAECQDLETCPPCYNNTLPDYDPSDPSKLVVDNSLYAFMDTTEQEYLARVAKLFPPEHAAVPYPSVFLGSGGRALMYLRRFDNFGNQSDLATAQMYAEAALDQSGRIPTTICGFLWGRTGIYAVAAVVRDRSNNQAGVQSLVDVLQEVFQASVDDDYCPYDDWDSGRAGLLYAASYLQEKLRWAEPVIPRNLVTAVAQAMVDRGARLSAAPTQYLEWLSARDDGIWLGQSHGTAGVLHGLLTVPEVVIDNATARSLVIGTVNHIVASQQPSGNFPTEYYSADEDALVQWDHGAPGVMSVLAQAALVYVDPVANPDVNLSSWLESAQRAADCTWERGLLVKGLMLCHGIGGNTYMQLQVSKLFTQLQASPSWDAHQITDIVPERYLWRALQFQQFVKDNPEVHDPNLMRKPTPDPYAFYIASYESAAALFNDLMARRNNPANATMPAY